MVKKGEINFTRAMMWKKAGIYVEKQTRHTLASKVAWYGNQDGRQDVR